MGVRKQSGCVVFKYDMNFNYLVLLVKSSDGKDWVFPKGGVEKHLSSQDSALKETYEEAGVTGRILNTLGTYRYRKQGQDQKVVMYSCLYTKDTPDWPEKALRKRKWFTAREARSKLPKILKPFIDELMDTKPMLATAGAIQSSHLAELIRELPVVVDHGAEVEAPDDNTVTVVLSSSDDDRLTVRIEDWGQHPQSEKLTIHYDYEHNGNEAKHFKHTTLSSVVGDVGRVIGRFLSGAM